MIRMQCIHCKKMMEGTEVDCPNDGISLRATGNYGSRAWDLPSDSLMFTAWLCDDCFNLINSGGYYLLFEEHLPPERKQITAGEALDPGSWGEVTPEDQAHLDILRMVCRGHSRE